MLNNYQPLQAHPLKTGSTFMRPTQILPEHVKLGDPAINVMTDFTKVSVVSVRTKTSMDKANAKMIRYGIRMLLALDDNDQVAGLLTASDVLGEKPMRYLQNMGGTHADILVRDIMTTQRELEAVNIEDVRNAQVGKIIATLKKFHRQHALVISEGTDGKQSVCGLFSITQIARQLGVQVQSFDLDHAFSQIEAAVAKG